MDSMFSASHIHLLVVVFLTCHGGQVSFPVVRDFLRLWKGWGTDRPTITLKRHSNKASGLIFKVI